MTAWTLARIRAYYREHAGLVASQLVDRIVLGYPPQPDPLPIDSAADVLRWTEQGVGGFRIPPVRRGQDRLDRLLVDLRPSDGADVATAAMAALGLRDGLMALGSRVVPMLNGEGGLQLLVRCEPVTVGVARARLDPLLSDYAAITPELATLDATRSGGRVLLSAVGTDPHVSSWAPYSLVPGREPGVVVPVDWDDVAAASAGMPLELEPEDVGQQLRGRGDPLDL